ncbi:T-cell surface antigen CD2-like [Cyprinodon tularosa]|uniref:T-cell surface antigen CD2-like n=1 Tax=Cyprinodon tularosa TaxID=77115 RepID=UPI0018E1EBA8|nr:T-cell surface antigen CD2-like [Cyprinodon tularosa]
MQRMMYFLATFGQILLLGLISFATANSSTCQIYAAVGESVTLPFFYKGLTKSNTLRWTHGNTIIFLREKGRITVGKPENITTTGSFLLRNVKLQNAGTYRVEALHLNNTLAKNWTGQLCVMEKVSKPQLHYSCDTVKLSCQVAKPEGLAFSWTIDKKTLPSETRQTLTISLSQLKEKSSISCSVANKVSAESSETVWPTCKVLKQNVGTLCFQTKTVVGVMAVGVVLVIILLIVNIILCSLYRRTKTKMQVCDEDRISIVFANKREPECSTVYENIDNKKSCSSPNPQPSPRAVYKPDVETETKPLQLSTAAKGQQPSPVPKPRTKNAKPLNI